MPNDHGKISAVNNIFINLKADLLVIDEAAAIPLVHVKSLLGPYIVFLASTINGYEGTGRCTFMNIIKSLIIKIGSEIERSKY